MDARFVRQKVDCSYHGIEVDDVLELTEAWFGLPRLATYRPSLPD
jgi:hypothetical protein